MIAEISRHTTAFDIYSTKPCSRKIGTMKYPQVWNVKNDWKSIDFLVTNLYPTYV